MYIKLRLRVSSLNHFMMLTVQRRIISKRTTETIQNKCIWNAKSNSVKKYTLTEVNKTESCQEYNKKSLSPSPFKLNMLKTTYIKKKTAQNQSNTQVKFQVVLLAVVEFFMVQLGFSVC